MAQNVDGEDNKLLRKVFIDDPLALYLKRHADSSFLSAFRKLAENDKRMRMSFREAKLTSIFKKMASSAKGKEKKCIEAIIVLLDENDSSDSSDTAMAKLGVPCKRKSTAPKEMLRRSARRHQQNADGH